MGRILFASLLCAVLGSSPADAAPRVEVDVRIDSAFSPFKTKDEERRFAIKNDHARGQLNPLPEVCVQVDGADAFKAQLAPRGDRKTGIYYGDGRAFVPATAKAFVVRVRIATQQIDLTQTLRADRGRFVSISSVRGKVRITQRRTAPRPATR